MTNFLACACLLGVLAGGACAAPPDAPQPKPNKTAWMLLTTVSFAAGAFDVDQTIRTKTLFSHHHFGLSPEGEPFMRPVVMAPNPVFISSAVVGASALAWASYRMQHSRHWVRHVWWVPQSIAIQWNVRGGVSQRSSRAWYAKLP
jgi:hypothetical protein